MLIAEKLFRLLALPEEYQLVLLFMVARRANNIEVGMFNRQKIDILSEQQGHRCCYCGVRFTDYPDYLTSSQRRRWRLASNEDPNRATIEHVIRRTDGGPTIWDNEVAACGACNQGRDDFDAFFYFEHREQILQGRSMARAYRLKQKHGRRNRQKVRHWQRARIGKSTPLGSFGEVWPQIENSIAVR